ncbi:MAG: energy transducer TonB [Deltaproteobacteria bacterium]|nr:energy transducer TonB [Deltaproteobacteria bacterium]MBW2052689.1 energy transducer TonB [Deltaproteobacteria bacterium]MBW2140979.1 energy transducer TonB [Deltaproteobacteria bacterium]MBW2323148.1 energy transducer TonB [Deltaproteobacteria bacterium]
MINFEGWRRQGLDLSLALIISVWIHILGFAFLRYVPPLPDAMSHPPPPMEVEIDVAVLEKVSPEELKKIAEKAQAEGEFEKAADSASQNGLQEDDTISLESKAPEYLSYMHQIKVLVKNNWFFPANALKKSLSGRLVAVFTLNREGRLLRVVLDTSSGHDILDQAAMDALRRAAPYPGFPDHIKLKRLNIKAVFDYRFKYVGVQ